jgi:hypothetical protein
MILKEDFTLSGINNIKYGGAVSLLEHPILGVNYLFVHPCQTAVFLEESFGKINKEGSILSVNSYIRNWLQVVGAVIGLKLDLAYFI